MKLQTLYVRFYKAFNYDFLRKSQSTSTDPWDVLSATDDRKFPFVKIPVEADITTVVGANEAGKTQVITAIECLLTGENIRSRDFCRYSGLVAVNKALQVPEFGGRFNDLDDTEREAVASAAGLPTDTVFDSFWFFRLNGANKIYVRSIDALGGTSEVSKDLTDAKLKSLPLPLVSKIDAEVPLPDDIALDYLTDAPSKRKPKSRKKRLALSRDMFKEGGWLTSKENFTKASDEAVDGFRDYTSASNQTPAKSLELAARLIFDIAGIQRDTLKALSEAVEAGDEGWANGITRAINQRLDDVLNFPKWWSQDAEFRLRVSLRDFDLVFTVQDRTGQEYSFGERSSGMSYFLSYFVQYLSFQWEDRQQILMMDEPDAKLSMQGQQDLLGLFKDFADPEDQGARKPVQVLYVTHSPFLIDKNHSERIRVLQKGDGDEGTRVVDNVGKNHYEPLRSALGAYVAETAFISNCNLMLEGQADQVLLAGISSIARRHGTTETTLDLNQLTLVPAGGAQQVPYMVYLARGRDVDKPAVAVLLDSDPEGNEAVRFLKKGYRGKRLVTDEMIVQVADVVSGESEPVLQLDVTAPVDIEDLVPAGILVKAVHHFAWEVLTAEDAQIVCANLKSIQPDPGETLFHAAEREVKAACATLDRTLELDKVGVARGVLATLNDPEVDATLLGTTINNFTRLFDHLDRAQRAARTTQASDRTRHNMKDLKTRFKKDHPLTATRREGRIVLEDLVALMPAKDLAAHQAADIVRTAVQEIASAHDLDREPTKPIDHYEGFLDELEKIVYSPLAAVQVQPAGRQGPDPEPQESSTSDRTRPELPTD